MGEPEILWEHEPQPSVSSSFSTKRSLSIFPRWNMDFNQSQRALYDMGISLKFG